MSHEGHTTIENGSMNSELCEHILDLYSAAVVIIVIFIKNIL